MGGNKKWFFEFSKIKPIYNERLNYLATENFVKVSDISEDNVNFERRDIMKKIFQLRKVTAGILSVCILFSMLFCTFTVTAAAEQATQTGNDFEIDITGYSALAEFEEDFDAYSFSDLSSSPVADNNGEAVAVASSQWRYNSNRLTVKTAGDGSYFKNQAVLTYSKASYKNLRLTYKFYQSSQQFGIMFGTQPGSFAYTGTKASTDYITPNGGVLVTVDSAGQARSLGAVINGDKTGYVSGASNIASETFGADSDTRKANIAALTEHTVEITVIDRVMTIKVDGLDSTKQVIQLTDDYNGGYVSLVASSQWQAQGFSYLKIEDLDVYDCIKDFTGFTSNETAWSALEEDFDAYYYASLKEDTYTGVSEAVSTHWRYVSSLKTITANTGNFSCSEGVSALTYNKKYYKDFEAVYTYAKQFDYMGIMFGTKPGEFAYSNMAYNSSTYMQGCTSRGGVWVTVGKNGATRVFGAVPTGTVNTAKIDEIDSAALGSSHTVKITVKNSVLTVITDDIEASKVVIPLTEDYNGGYISLAASTNSSTTGGFANLTIRDLGGNEYDYNRDFNSLYSANSSTTHLYINGGDAKQYPYNFNTETVMESFKSFHYPHVESRTIAEASPVSDYFKITSSTSNRIMIKDKITLADDNGSAVEPTDYTNWSVATYTSKQYTDFVATYTFNQSYKRFGLMFGTELGEFAYSGTSVDNIQSNGGVLVYIEAEGTRTAIGAVQPSSTRSNFNRTVDKLSTYYNSEGKADIGRLSTVEITVSQGYLKIIVDGLEESETIIKLTDDYKGGYISLVTNDNAVSGGFSSFSVREIQSVDKASSLTLDNSDNVSAIYSSAPNQKYRLIYTATGEVTAEIDGNVSNTVGQNTLEFYATDLTCELSFKAESGGSISDVSLDMIPDDYIVRLEREALSEDRIAVSVITEKPCSAIDIKLCFDTENLSFKLGEIDQSISSLNKGQVLTAADGKVSISLTGEHQGKWATLIFNKNGDTPSKFTVEVGSNFISPGGINDNADVHQVIYGDANSDYIVDIRDLVRIKKYSAQIIDESLIDILSADIGKSGGVEAEDLTLLRKFFLADATEQSVLNGKTALYLGDSIAYGANDDSLHRAWGGRIAERYSMLSTNVAKSGWTLSTYKSAIVTQLDNADAANYDYIILHGGVNDVSANKSASNVEIGTVDEDNFTPGSFDCTTVAGALEDLICTAKQKAPNAKIGYIINYDISEKIGDMQGYYLIAKMICEKWDIPYLDLYDNTDFSSVFDQSLYLADGVHPNSSGYEILADFIADWMETL